MSLLRPLLGALVVLTSCSSPRDREPAVRELYSEAAARHVRNPVVVVHGILGARLEERESGRTVWGAFTPDALDPDCADGARALALPFGELALDGSYDPEAAAVFATGPLQAIELSLLFAVVNVGVYVDILRALGVGGYTDPVEVDPRSPAYAEDHYTCFTFFYDWRRDCVDNAIAFGAFLSDLRERVAGSARRRLSQLRADPMDDAAVREAEELELWLRDGYRFDVVAHSMGGLVARYFLRYGAEPLPADGTLPAVTWAGAEQIDRLVLIGTPSGGSMEALQNLLCGFDPGGILLPHYDAALLGTMTSIYQLLPRGDGLFVDAAGEPVELALFDVGTWDRNSWGLLSPDADRYLRWLLPDAVDAIERRSAALAAVAANLERARRFHAAIDAPAMGCPAELRLFAADTERTLARARVLDADGRQRLEFDGDDLREFGDATVTRRSALADRRGPDMRRQWLESAVAWDSVVFLPDDHIGLTRNPIFLDNLLFYLLEQEPRPR